MTPHTTVPWAWAAQSGPVWIHLVVMAFAVLVLVTTLIRHR
ncbi:hypothetical protein [Streptomyces sp. NPDC127112]